MTNHTMARFWLFGLLAAACTGVRADIPGGVYTGEDATGPDVVALWSFQPGAETEDASGRGHSLSLQGKARFTPDGKFGSCLDPMKTEASNRHGAFSSPSPDLSFPGAFTIELWIHPDPELADRNLAYLVDKMNVYYAHRDLSRECLRDYMLMLVRDTEGRHRVKMNLGFGREGGLAVYSSDPHAFTPGEWHHLAFTYDGAGGGRFYINGRLKGEKQYSGRGPVLAGRRGVMIGDRGGAYNASFPGRIDEVRLLNRAMVFSSGTLELRQTSIRRNFVRMEKDASLDITVLNGMDAPAEQVELTLCMPGADAAVYDLPELAPGERHTVRHFIDTTLRAGTYPLKAVLSAGDQRVEMDIPMGITDRDLPLRLPVVAWTHHSSAWMPFSDFSKVLRDIGFTHRLHDTGGIEEMVVWSEGRPVPEGPDAYFRQADESLALGMKLCMDAVWTSPPQPKIISFFDNGRFNRINRAGIPKSHFNACGLFPELQAFSYNVGASIAQAYHDYPAWAAVLPQSEQRDGTMPCFHDHDIAAFRAHAGFDIPREVAGRRGVDYTSLDPFPPDRIISDDHPILTYYRWFWKNGDGWNALHSRIHDGVKSTGRKDIWTWFDPAVRVPSIWGSGGKVDFISQWTYTYPNPEVIGLNTDELFAMAAGNPDQDVMKMTQIIWYRSKTAPQVSDYVKADWEKTYPDPTRAKWITISPDHISEAFWSELSRPVRGIMYHGFASLLPLYPIDRHGSYVYTHPETRETLRGLLRRVAEPLGPTLLQVPDPAPEIAFLQSFTSQMFTRGGTYGWGGEIGRAGSSWAADSYLALRYAQLQPKIVYEEEILERGLDGIKILFMTDCAVLTESLARKIRAFQNRGGIVVGDERLAPGILPDLTLRSYARSKQGDLARQALLDTAVRVRKNLDAYVTRFTDTDNPDVLTRLRRYGSTDYVFAYNDNRQFGTYVGHHGLVMEDGVPSSATVKVRRAGGHVYDLLEHRAVAAAVSDGWLEIPRDFDAGEGRLWMVTARPIGAVRIRAPERVQRGEQFAVEIAVTDPRGKRLDAVVPVRVEILDARGASMEFSGHYGAKDGQVDLAYDTAANDAPGDWIVRATELASGQSAEAAIRVE